MPKNLVKEQIYANWGVSSKSIFRTNGIEVTDTDLGERIVQLRGEPPSHVVAPAIHLTKEEVSKTFQKHLGTKNEREWPNIPPHTRG